MFSTKEDFMKKKNKYNLEIKLKDIKRINKYLIEIFEEEDSSYPDYRIIRPKENAIDRILNKITKDDKQQKEILSIIDKHTFNMEDFTYKPICNDLRKMGYKITYKE